MKLADKTASELQELLHSKELTIAELTEATFKRIQELDPKVDAFLALNEEQATKQATEMDQTDATERGPLFGLPIGVKDNIVTEGLETTASSLILKGFNPIYNATVVDKLREAGMVIVGKLNMDEFAMGSSNENSYYKNTKNPWNLETVQAVLQAVRLQRLLLEKCHFHSVPIQVDPFASQPLLRRCRHEADLRARFSFRFDRLCVIVRPNWPDYAYRQRQCASFERYFRAR